ncbi:MAG: OmpA family protein, partial [Steroidobacteraceae bacterium]
WRVLQPLAWFEPVDDEEAMLQPGERTEQTVPIFFSDEGWTFARSGKYEVRARLQTGENGTDAVSAPVRIDIEDPRDADDSAALQPLLDAQGQLDEKIGRMLAFGGRIDSEGGLVPLEAAVQTSGHTALGAALRLTLITQRLRPPIDPLTGERPAPDFGDARELLIDTCTDSGIAALKWQLLQRHAGGIPDAMSNRAETGGTAWDGTTSIRGNTMPTYSDAALRPWGPSLHFCFSESQVRGAVRAALPRLARQLHKEKPSRIVVVGHADHEGTCRYNDVLAMRRAEAVRRALIDAGVRAGSITVASLGERRPLDFGSTREARDLNRRVEILVEGQD